MALITSNQFQLTPQVQPIADRLIRILQRRENINRQDEAIQKQELQAKMKVMAAQMLRLRGLDNSQDQKRELAKLAREAIKGGLPSDIYENGLDIEDPDELNLYFTRMATQSQDVADLMLKQEFGLNQRAKTRAFAPVTLVNPETDEKMLVTPTFDPNTQQAKLSPFDIPEGFEISTETPEEKRAADQIAAIEETEQKESIKTKETLERERGKKGIALNWDARIKEKVKEAETKAKAKGEALTELDQMEAALPLLMESIGELRDLAEVATYTTGGKIWDTVVKESGFGSTEGATARAKFIAIVDNQVLPLLKPTFGAAFTVQEGESLKATMGDPDATPEAKMAQLDAFIAQKVRDIRSKKRQIGEEVEEIDFSTMTDEQLRAILEE